MEDLYEKHKQQDAATQKRLTETLTIAMIRFAAFNYPKKSVLIATCEMIAEIIAQEYPQYIDKDN